jgi:hypothetical protein
MVEFADFNHGPKETPMTDTDMPLIELLQKHDDGDFLRAVTEAVLQTCVDAPLDASDSWRVRACDQVRSCVQPRSCGLSCAAGLYGDMQVRTSSLTRARWRIVRNDGSPDPVS